MFKNICSEFRLRQSFLPQILDVGGNDFFLLNVMGKWLVGERSVRSADG